MVIDVAKWKQLSIAEKALSKAIKAVNEDPESLECYDQDPLNLVWGGEVGELALEWNAQSSVFMPNSRMRAENIDTSVARTNPKILHYTMTNCKPWKKECFHPVIEPYDFFLKDVENHFKKYQYTNIF
jgi:lipopolysaccharide biosynthesis glycosyltransferase